MQEGQAVLAYTFYVAKIPKVSHAREAQPYEIEDSYPRITNPGIDKLVELLESYDFKVDRFRSTERYTDCHTCIPSREEYTTPLATRSFDTLVQELKKEEVSENLYPTMNGYKIQFGKPYEKGNYQTYIEKGTIPYGQFDVINVHEEPGTFTLELSNFDPKSSGSHRCFGKGVQCTLTWYEGKEHTEMLRPTEPFDKTVKDNRFNEVVDLIKKFYDQD